MSRTDQIVSRYIVPVALIIAGLCVVAVGAVYWQ